MKFSEFSKYLSELEKTPGRLEITRILSELLKKSGVDEIDKVTYLSLGILAPNYEGVILNLAEKMVLRTFTAAYTKNEVEITKLYKKTGDVGDVAEVLSSESGFNNKVSLTVAEVYEILRMIAEDNGNGSQEKKMQKLADLLKNLDPLSARFVARIPVGRLRLGFSEKTIMDALQLVSKADGKAFTSEEIEGAYNVRPDIGFIAKLVKEKKLKEVTPKLGVPVVPMLAQRLNSTSEMVKKMGEVSVEPKFDGLRIFIHFRRKDNYIGIFTRNMNAIDINTFPEILNVGKFIKADEVILDTEAVGLDPVREGFLDFQKTIQRRRKHNIEKNASEIPLQFQVFDLLLVNGESLINVPYKERRKIIEKTIINGSLLRVDENTITTDADKIKLLHEKYLKMGLEGVVVKKANSGYVSGRTGWNWVKMKEEEGRQGRLSDTIDCVIMGYTSGKGKRASFGIGQFLAGVKDGDLFKTITKVGTGLSDEQFKELSNRLKEISINEKPKEYSVHKDLSPDYWVLPRVVVELAADEITVSPKHTAGYALRFPRLIKFRDDKSATEATTLSELSEMVSTKEN